MQKQSALESDHDAHALHARGRVRGLQIREPVNRLNEHDLVRPQEGTMITIDQRRRALEHRLEFAKERLVADLDRVSTLLTSGVVESARSVGKNLFRVAVVVGGLLLLGLVTSLVRRRRRLEWRYR